MINRMRHGEMLLEGETLYTLEVAPAGYAALAANEAEKRADVKLLEMVTFGAVGRVWLGGGEEEIRQAAAAVDETLAALAGAGAGRRGDDRAGRGRAASRRSTASTRRSRSGCCGGARLGRRLRRSLLRAPLGRRLRARGRAHPDRRPRRDAGARRPRAARRRHRLRVHRGAVGGSHARGGAHGGADRVVGRRARPDRRSARSRWPIAIRSPSRRWRARAPTRSRCSGGPTPRRAPSIRASCASRPRSPRSSARSWS